MQGGRDLPGLFKRRCPSDSTFPAQKQVSSVEDGPKRIRAIRVEGDRVPATVLMGSFDLRP